MTPCNQRVVHRPNLLRVNFGALGTDAFPHDNLALVRERDGDVALASRDGYGDGRCLRHGRRVAQRDFGGRTHELAGARLGLCEAKLCDHMALCDSRADRRVRGGSEGDRRTTAAMESVEPALLQLRASARLSGATVWLQNKHLARRVGCHDRVARRHRGDGNVRLAGAEQPGPAATAASNRRIVRRIVLDVGL